MQTNSPTHASMAGMPNFTDPGTTICAVDHAQGAILGDTFAQFAEYVDANSDKHDDAKIETEYDRRSESTRTARKRSQPWVACARWPIPSSVTITFTTPEYRSNCRSDGGHLLPIDRERERHDVDVEKVRPAAGAQAMLEKRAAEKSWRGWECRRSHRRWRPSRDTCIFMVKINRPVGSSR